MPPPNIAGAAALSWFQRIPSFQGAEILSIHLNRVGPSKIRIHAWAAGMQDLGAGAGDAIIVFEFEGIKQLRLQADEAEGRSVVRALQFERTALGYRLELFPSHGIGGEIVAEEMAIRIEGGG